MSEALRDKQGRFICQLCGKHIARIWTFHRRTEADHYITYRDGQVVFDKLPKDGGIAAYCRDEYLCFRCCFKECGPGEIDIPADLEPGQSPEIREPQERVEYEAGFDPNLSDDEMDDFDEEEDFDDAPPATESRRYELPDARLDNVTELTLADEDEEKSTRRHAELAVTWGR